MSLSNITEFELIEKFFAHRKSDRKDVILGIGDDCALLSVPEGQKLAVSMDTLIEGVHFPTGTAAAAIAHKAVAVNLSDLAAMGAEPAWLTISISMPETDVAWLSEFGKSLYQLSEHYGTQIVGGDTTKGHLSITVQAHGFVPEGVALRRSNAKVGDLIFITGTVGDAGLGLKIAQGEHHAKAPHHDYLLLRLNMPTPRLAVGIALRGIANSCIDISDGVVADLQHILDASHVGAMLEVADLPISASLQSELPLEQAQLLALTSGDDYELCFTVPEDKVAELEMRMRETAVAYRCVGRIMAKPQLKLSHNGNEMTVNYTGYRHF